MSSDASNIVAQAIDWHLRRDAMTEGDWAAFVAWLEAASAHAHAYDSIVRQDRLIAEATFPHLPTAANDDVPAPRRWLRLAGGGAVAALLAVWLVPLAIAPHSKQQVYATRDGERRDVRLGDGTQIAMNGGTVLRVDPADGRSAELDRGQVTLDVVHDARRPFTLRAGDQVIQDLGTTFDVARDGDRLAVAVAEGSVMYQPGKDDVRLVAGQAIDVDRAGGKVIRSVVAADTVGGWRTGVLDFSGAPMSTVVASLRRLEAIDLVIEGGLSQRPFTGMIHVTGAADRDVPHLADLIGATWRRDGERWVLAERANTAR